MGLVFLLANHGYAMNRNSCEAGKHSSGRSAGPYRPAAGVQNLVPVAGGIPLNVSATD